MSDTATTTTCAECSAPDGMHRIGCSVLTELHRALGVPSIARADVNGQPALIVAAEPEPEPLIEAPPLTLHEAVAILANAMRDYDAAKAAHRTTTEELSECKKALDACARGVIDAEAREHEPELPLADDDR